MRLAVENGVYDLDTIRGAYNDFAEGGDTKPDWSYDSWKRQIAEHMGIRPDEDNTYDYEAYFNKYPEEAWKMLKGDPTAHFTDEFKTVYHPTFSSKSIGNDGSIYSGVKNPRTNPQGLVGGSWSPDYKVFTMSPDGYRGPVSMDERRAYLENAEDNGVQLREADGSLPIYDGILWGGVLPNVTVYGMKHSNGGKIHIKPENRGKFTRLKERTGHSATWFKEHGTPAQRKMATFALNARHWKHGLGGPLVEAANIYDGTTENSQQMNIMAYHPIEDYFTGPSATMPEINVTRKKDGKTYVGLGDFSKRYDKQKEQPYFVSSRTGQLTAANAAKAWDAMVTPALSWALPNVFRGIDAAQRGDAVGVGKEALKAAGLKGVGALAANPSLVAPGSTFWMNPITQRMVAGAGMAKGFDAAANMAGDYGSWGEGVSDVVNQATGWNPQDSWWGQFLAESTNPAFLMNPTRITNAVGRVSSAVNKAINNGGFALSTPYLGDYLASKGAGKFTAWVPFDRPWNKGISWMATGKPTLDGVAASGKPTYNGVPIAMIKSKYPGEGRKLYDAGIKIAQDNGYDGLLVGDNLISAPKSYRTFEHYYPDRTYLDDFGLWSNKNMIQGTPIDRKSVYSIDDFMTATAENPKETVIFAGAPRYRLERPSTEGSTTTPKGLLSDEPLIARGTSEITAENAASITPKVNWDADNWFRTISGRNSYSAEEAAELASHVPEYRAIEQRLFNEGKLALDSNENIIVVGSEMSPQEYIMRQSEAFKKMNPEHHYVGVSKGLRNSFENEARDPNTRNRYEVWTDRKSPKNVEEYAQSQQGGYTIDSNIERLQHGMTIRKENYELHQEQLKWKYEHGKISQETYNQDLKALKDNYIERQEEAQKELDILVQQKQKNPLNGGKVFDVTYPKEAVETPIINAENNHWASIPFDNVVRDAPDVISHYTQRPYSNVLQTDQIISAARRNGYGVTHIDNVMDTYDGTMLNETIIGRNTPVKSVLGNTGTFDLEGFNKWKLYRSLLPPFVGLGTLGTMYGVSTDKTSYR